MNKEEWAVYTAKEQQVEREHAEEVLKEMKQLEEEYKRTRTVITEKTSTGGIRTRYILKDGNQR